MHYVNAAHCPPIWSSGRTAIASNLEATGMPVGLIEDAEFAVAEQRCRPATRS